MGPPRIISMELDTSGRSDCDFRILAGDNVKYITVKAGALDAETLLDMPLNFQNIIPMLPYDQNDWNSAYISRDESSGNLTTTLSQTELPGVQAIWHSETINFLELSRTKLLSVLSFECVRKQVSSKDDSVSETPEIEISRVMIAKVARFWWEVQYIEAETQIYKLLQPLGITPKFLGHIHEGGRVIGFLLERVEGRAAGIQDLAICRTALQRLHHLRILHGDSNRYNFIVGTNGKVTLIDFEKSKVDAEASLLENEMALLEEQLREETGRGGGFMFVDTDQSD
ncbi:hypothetical protein G7046_g3889 [Stylonectria norvegica]|nr:hypothetical protein G7046_g3889 [Stylonectria norvegica]